MNTKGLLIAGVALLAAWQLSKIGTLALDQRVALKATPTQKGYVAIVQPGGLYTISWDDFALPSSTHPATELIALAPGQQVTALPMQLHHGIAKRRWR